MQCKEQNNHYYPMKCEGDTVYDRLGNCLVCSMKLATSINANSEHLLADTIVAGAKEKNMELMKMDKFESFTGKEVKAIYQGKKIALRNQKLVDEFQANLDEGKKKVEEWQLKAQTVIHLIIDNKVEGIVTAYDT